MVDVGEKEVSRRVAVAEALVSMSPSTISLILEGKIPKGDVFSVARISGIMGAKRTPELIPLCHPIRVDSVEVDFQVEAESGVIRVEAVSRATDRTGVEMEAMVAAAISALTIYDMCKQVEHGIEISSVRLLKKSGGRSGTWWSKKSNREER
ncbi:MAG: cyclic pyranopterin monophosphate synthase MoaC [Actinomycetota bacterium]|nr:cyclic pyranopterin monophosphate synthase MoaC [Actinomycetota bacterium]